MVNNQPKQRLAEDISAYITYLHDTRQPSQNTLDNYQRDLTNFLRKLPKELRQWQDVDILHVREFAMQAHRDGLSPRSIQRKLSVIRTFFQYLISVSRATINPAKGVTSPKQQVQLTTPLSADTIQLLLNFECSKAIDYRDHAMLNMFYAAGLRLEEVTNLNVEDIDFIKQQVTIRGASNRTLPIGTKACRSIQQWMKHRKKWEEKNTDNALFLSTQGKRIKHRSIQLRLNHWVKKQEIEANITPEKLRHAFATHLLAASGNLKAVQKFLGHAHIATTQAYTQSAPSSLSEACHTSHPRSSQKTSPN